MLDRACHVETRPVTRMGREGEGAPHQRFLLQVGEPGQLSHEAVVSAGDHRDGQ